LPKSRRRKLLGSSAGQGGEPFFTLAFAKEGERREKGGTQVFATRFEGGNRCPVYSKSRKKKEKKAAISKGERGVECRPGRVQRTSIPLSDLGRKKGERERNYKCPNDLG